MGVMEYVGRSQGSSSKHLSSAPLGAGTEVRAVAMTVERFSP